MARFTLPRDLYHGKGALEALKTFKGKKAIICVGGGSMKRFGFLQKAEDYLKKGDIVDLKIIDLDKEAKKLSLSIKALTPEPWSNVEEKYPVDSIVLGKVVRINDFGAFVELEPGVDGLVHISKISHERIENPAQVLEVGQEIKAKILSVDAEKKRISLSMKDI